MTKRRQSAPLSQTAARLGLGGFMTAAGLSLALIHISEPTRPY